MLCRSLRFRMLAAALLTVVLALAGLDHVLGRVVAGVIAEDVSARLDAALDALAAGLDRDRATGALMLRAPPPGPAFGTPFSGWYWQVAQRDRVILASASLWQAELVPDAPGPQGEALIQRARRVAPPDGGEPLEIRVAAPLAVQQAELAAARQPVRVALAAVGAALLAAMLAQIALLLAPFDGLRRDLGLLRQGRLPALPASRVAEIAPLVEEVNALRALDAERVARAERHAADLAHGIKTPLAAIRNAAEAQGGAVRETVVRAAARIERQLRHHLARARIVAGASSGTRTPVPPVIGDLVALQRGLHARRGLRLLVDAPAPPDFAGGRADLEEMLGNLLDNACNWAEAEVRLSATGQSGRLRVTVEDDGPGMEEGAIEHALVRGARLDESRAGHGLGLAIVTALATQHGAALRLDASPLGGLRATLDLPAAA